MTSRIAGPTTDTSSLITLAAPSRASCLAKSASFTVQQWTPRPSAFARREELVRDEAGLRADRAAALRKVGPESALGAARRRVVVQARLDARLDLADPAEHVGREGEDERAVEEMQLGDEGRDAELEEAGPRREGPA